MPHNITSQKIEQYKEYLKQHPIDHSFDELFECLDGEFPREQAISRMIYNLLKDLGEIDVSKKVL